MLKRLSIIFFLSLSSSVFADEADNRILECGLEAKADFIISGDHHLLELKEHQGIRIITPSDLMKGYCK